MRIGLFSLAALLVATAPAAAQTTERGYVQGFAGVASTAADDQFLGGSAALRAFGRVDAFVEIGKLRNGIWPALDRELDTASDEIREEIARQFGTSVSVSFDARVPMIYEFAGARVRGPRFRQVGTYVEGGAGLAQLRPEIDLEIDGIALGDEVSRVLELDDERTELMTGVGAGVSVLVLRQVRVEAGYRFTRVHGDFAFNFNRVHVGVGFAF